MTKSSEKKLEFLLCQTNPFFKILKKKNLEDERKKEEYIEKIFGENLSNIFPNLVFLDTQFCLEIPDKGGNCRLDTLAFNKKGDYFIAIEYKRNKSPGLGSQIKTYLYCLEDVHNQYSLLEILNNKIGKKLKHREVDWDKTRGICITAENDKRTDWLRKEINIALVEVKFYDENILYIDTKRLPEWLEITPNERDNRSYEEPKPKPIDQGIPDILEETGKWLEEVEAYIYSLKPLERKVWEKEGYWPRIRYYDQATNKVLVSLIVRTKKVNIYWNLGHPQEISQNLKNLLDDHGIYYSEKDHGVGKGNWFFSIESEASLQKLKNFFQEYKKQFSESSETFN